MSSIGDPGELRPRYVEAVCGPAHDGKIRVYAGDLEINDGESVWVTQGDLILSLTERPAFSAEFAGDDHRLMSCLFGAMDAEITVPVGVTLTPSPVESVLVEPEEKRAGWCEGSLPVTDLETGDLSRAEHILLHVSGHLSDCPLPAVETATEAAQAQLAFQLGDWSLRLAELDRTGKTGGFTYVIEATPQSIPVAKDAVQVLIRQVFTLLRFTAGGGITVGPRVGLDASGATVWAWWGPGRTEKSVWRWCPNNLVNTALPEIADGISALSVDQGLYECVDRAVSLLLATNEGVLDTRIPIACIGLELLSWAVLQHKAGLTKADLESRSAGINVHKLLDWAGIDAALPGDHTALAARLARVNNADWAGPEVVFNVRNALVHPPKQITDPEWPEWKELVEAWQLATWYLEVVLLRVLGYQGEYTSRLQLRGWEGQTEPLPWNGTPEADK